MRSHTHPWSRSLAAFAIVLSLAVPIRAEEPQKVVQEGISVELSVQRSDGTPGPVMEGQDARVTLKVTDKLTGNPLTGLYPGAWIDKLNREGVEPDATCKKKVEAFIGGGLLSRPAMDLN